MAVLKPTMPIPPYPEAKLAVGGHSVIHAMITTLLFPRM
jgi:hypothetical protein